MPNVLAPNSPGESSLAKGQDFEGAQQHAKVKYPKHKKRIN